jgi:phenylpyruvate tautomerase PptA (4-oxalocrotonate tautomerase family)
MPEEKIELSKREATLIKELLSPGAELTIVIPEEVDAEKWIAAFFATVKAIELTEQKRESLMPVLVRVLQVAKANPATYKAMGHETFEVFLEKEIKTKFRWGRTTCYNLLEVLRVFPQITPADLKELGPVKLKVLAGSMHHPEAAAAPSNVALFEKAKDLTVVELKALCAEKGLSEIGDHEGAWFQVPCSKSELSMYEEFFKDPRIHATCGSDAKAKILAAMVAECVVEWIGAGEALTERNGEDHNGTSPSAWRNTQAKRFGISL